MKTELEKFIEKESNKELQEHHLFLTQLFLLTKEEDKKNGGKPVSVFQVLLQYLMEIMNRDNPILNEYINLLKSKFDEKN
jgi:hypothetical protein